MTISEIAEKAGVSIGTVDRVIHNRGRVSVETRKKIETIIAESGYKPNPIAQHLKKKKGYSVGVLIPELKSEGGYWNLIYEGMKEVAKEIAPFSVSLLKKEYDRSSSVSFLEAGHFLLHNEVDALVLAPMLPDEAYQIIELLGDKPYAFVDSFLPNTAPLTSAVQNAFQAGYCAGRVMNLLAPEAKTIVCIQMHRTAYNQSERSHGFMTWYAKKTDVLPIHRVCDRHHSENVFSSFCTLMDGLYKEFSKIDGIFMTNDAVHMVGEYFDLKKMQKNCIVIGFDLQKDNIDGLLNDSIDMIISQQPHSQGYNSVHEIFKAIVLHQQPEPKVDIPIDIYFKENLMEYTVQ